MAKLSGKRFTLIGVDTCRGSGIEGPGRKNYHGEAVTEGGGTFAGILHKNIIECGHSDLISIIVADSVTASTFFAEIGCIWMRATITRRGGRHHRVATEGQGRWLAVG